MYHWKQLFTNNSNTTNSSHFYSAISHWQGRAHYALQDQQKCIHKNHYALQNQQKCIHKIYNKKKNTMLYKINKNVHQKTLK